MIEAPDREELAAWLRLLDTPSLGRESIRKLLALFGSPQAVFAASPSALRDIGNPALVAALIDVPAADVSKPLSATLAWLAEADDAQPRHVVAIGDPRYPQMLLESADPPLLLYAQGRIELLQAEAVAIVGSRNPTAQGLENARAFAAHLSGEGVLVVSGLAIGIDGAAHEGALEGRGSTIAVVGTGLDRVYPRRHLALARRIAQHGLMLSEYALGTPPMAPHFPQRNRIIAGLARGTLVVEAAQPSGSLITARMALESSREVFAIPGSIHSPQSRGCNALIKQGAKLVDCAQDILEELQLSPGSTRTLDMMNSDNHKASKAHAGEHAHEHENGRRHQAGPVQEQQQEQARPEDPLLEVLGFDPMSLDELVARTGQSSHALSGRLLELELQGLVSRMPGQLFQRLFIV